VHSEEKNTWVREKRVILSVSLASDGGDGGGHGGGDSGVLAGRKMGRPNHVRKVV